MVSTVTRCDTQGHVYGAASVPSRELGYLERALHERIAPCIPADPCPPGTTRPLQVIDQFEYIAILSWLVVSWQQWTYINSIIVSIFVLSQVSTSMQNMAPANLPQHTSDGEGHCLS